MKCSICKEKDAEFCCKFCGRLVCEDHRHFKPYIMAAYDEDQDKPKVMVVEDATWCSKCSPTTNSIKIKGLE